MKEAAFALIFPAPLRSSLGEPTTNPVDNCALCAPIMKVAA
jgi:hypothetical protein